MAMIKPRKALKIAGGASPSDCLKLASYISDIIPLNTDELIMDTSDLVPVNLAEHISNAGMYEPGIPLYELGKHLLNASKSGNIDEMKSLMGRGAAFTSDWLGACPLHYAAMNNHVEACEVLLRAGISRNSRTKVDKTPLHMAVYEGHMDVVQCLLRHSADLECRDMLFMTPLHWAVEKDHYDIAGLLLRHGANPHVRNKFGNAPLDIALQHTNNEVILKLIQTAMKDIEESGNSATMDEDDDNTVDTDVDVPETVQNGRGFANIAEVLQCKLEVENSNVDTNGSIDLTNNSSSEYLNDVRRNPDIVTIENIEDGDNNLCGRINSTMSSREGAYLDKESDLETTVDIDLTQNSDVENSYKLLQQHGIEILPLDENNVLKSAIETGHTVALTEAGKRALNAFKPITTNTSKPAPIPKYVNSTPAVKMKPFAKPPPKQLTNTIRLSNTQGDAIQLSEVRADPLKLADMQSETMKLSETLLTLTPDEFAGLQANGGILTTANGVYKIIDAIGTTMGPKRKRPVMKRTYTNDHQPKTKTIAQIERHVTASETIETLRQQLHESRQMTDIYKKKYLKKDAEAERFKQQLKLMLEKNSR